VPAVHDPPTCVDAVPRGESGFVFSPQDAVASGASPNPRKLAFVLFNLSSIVLEPIDP
jgi:hypothetical protein